MEERGNGISGANFCIVFHNYGPILLSFWHVTTEQTTDGQNNVSNQRHALTVGQQ